MAKADKIFLWVGPWPYRLRFCKYGMLDERGGYVDGAILYKEREIWLARDVGDVSARIATIIHEIRHAWEHHVGIPKDAETECQLTATIAEQMRRDLRRIGGNRRIARLHPEPLPKAFSNPIICKCRRVISQQFDHSRANQAPRKNIPPAMAAKAS